MQTNILIHSSHQAVSMEDIDLNPTDRAILSMLREGRCSPAYIASEQNYSRQNVTNRLGRLVEHGYVRKLHAGLYELTKDPEEE
ncbi:MULTISPECIES: winged helix-turn-helix domain-containing protein [Haloferax]|nr:winged helix-turn-helix domain-containing protein [Haloferax litoreum]